MKRELILPDDFDDYAWEVGAKGCLTGISVRIGEMVLPVVFYEPARLSQDIAEELSAGRTFSTVRLLVVERVTESAMRLAVTQAPPATFQ